MKKLLLSLLLMAMVATSMARTLTFATEATYPPFESVTNTGEIVGFDADIMHALCADMKVTCVLVNVPFDSIIPSLRVGKFDAAIAAISITEQRKQVVDFTHSYLEGSASFIAKKGSGLVVTPAGLKGKIIGTQGDTTLYQYLKSTYGTLIKINTYTSESSAFLDLTAGRVNAVMGDTYVVGKWLLENNHAKDYEFVGEHVTDPKFFGLGNGIAVKKGNTQLLAQLNQALVNIKENGTYKKITKKWFDI